MSKKEVKTERIYLRVSKEFKDKLQDKENISKYIIELIEKDLNGGNNNDR